MHDQDSIRDSAANIYNDSGLYNDKETLDMCLLQQCGTENKIYLHTK